MIRNLHLNPEGPVPQSVLNPSIKTLAANVLGRIGGTSSFPIGRQAGSREKGDFSILQRGKGDHPCEISGRVDIGRLSRQEVRNIIKLRVDLGCYASTKSNKATNVEDRFRVLTWE